MFTSQSQFKNSTKIVYDALKSNNQMKLTSFRELLAKSTPYGSLSAYMASIQSEATINPIVNKTKSSESKLSVSEIIDLFLTSEIKVESAENVDVQMSGDKITISYKPVSTFENLRSSKNRVSYEIYYSYLKEYSFSNGIFTFSTDTYVDEMVDEPTTLNIIFYRPFSYGSQNIELRNDHVLIDLKMENKYKNGLSDSCIHLDYDDGTVDGRICGKDLAYEKLVCWSQTIGQKELTSEDLTKAEEFGIIDTENFMFTLTTL